MLWVWVGSFLGSFVQNAWLPGPFFVWPGLAVRGRQVLGGGAVAFLRSIATLRVEEFTQNYQCCFFLGWIDVKVLRSPIYVGPHAGHHVSLCHMQDMS